MKLSDDLTTINAPCGCVFDFDSGASVARCKLHDPAMRGLSVSEWVWLVVVVSIFLGLMTRFAGWWLQ